MIFWLLVFVGGLFNLVKGLQASPRTRRCAPTGGSTGELFNCESGAGVAFGSVAACALAGWRLYVLWNRPS